jgi:predicted NAD/FAD-binding protein
MRRRVAVVGAGISGIAAAHHLQQRCDVTLFEAADRLGGHTDTHQIAVSNDSYGVDSGFIVFNERNYPLFTTWLDELGVASKPSDMSFGVRNLDTGLEYGTVGLSGLFAQRRNLANPRYWRMLADVRRFYHEAADAPERHGETTLGDYLAGARYSKAFAEDHIGPMCAALWSQPVGAALDIPLGHVVAFMEHHLMLEFQGRPQWRVVEGGSSRYLQAFEDRFQGTIRRGEPVARIVRRPGAAVVESRSGAEPFDAVFVACHSDQALRLLADPSPAESVISAITWSCTQTRV